VDFFAYFLVKIIENYLKKLLFYRTGIIIFLLCLSMAGSFVWIPAFAGMTANKLINSYLKGFILLYLKNKNKSILTKITFFANV